MKNITLWGLVAGAAAATAIIVSYKRKDGTRLVDELQNSANRIQENLSKFAFKLKKRLLHNQSGPNGEPLYVDMYDRQFYENEDGRRVYLEMT